MAYEEIKDGIIKNINTRKEFYSLKLPYDKTETGLSKKEFNISGIIRDSQIKKLGDNIIPRFISEREIRHGNYFR